MNKKLKFKLNIQNFAETPFKGSDDVPVDYSEAMKGVKTIASQKIKEVESTNKIKDAFYEYAVKDGNIIQEGLIHMAEGEDYDGVAEGEEPDLSPKDPKVSFRYFDNFKKRKYKTTTRETEIRQINAGKGETDESIATSVVDTLTQGEGDDDYNKMRGALENGDFGVDASTDLLGGKHPTSSKGIMIAVRRMFTAIRATHTRGLNASNYEQGATLPKQGVRPENIRVAISEDVLALIDMTELANLFNLEKEELMGKLVKLPYDANYTGTRICVYDRKALGRATRLIRYGQKNFEDTDLYTIHTLITDRAYFYNPLFKAYVLDVSVAVANEEAKHFEDNATNAEEPHA